MTKPQGDPNAGLGCATALTGIGCGPTTFGCLWVLFAVGLFAFLSALGVDIAQGNGLTALGWAVVVVTGLVALMLTVLIVAGARERNKKE